MYESMDFEDRRVIVDDVRETRLPDFEFGKRTVSQRLEEIVGHSPLRVRDFV